jgi:hypothetical protein
MKYSFIVFCTILCGGIFQSVSPQVATSSVPFLMIAPNTRASGMGEIGVALGDDAWATFWNPAGYAFQSGSEAAINFANWQPAFNLGDVWIAHSVYKQEGKGVGLDGTLSAALTYLNHGDIGRTLNDATILETFKSYEIALAFGYATKLSDVFGIGFNMRIIHSAISPFGTPQGAGSGVATGFSVDVGMLYHPNSFFIPFTTSDLGDRLSIGFNLSNIGPKLSYVNKSKADPIPMNLRLGFAFQLIKSVENNITIAADFNKMLVNYHNDTSDEFYKAMFTSWSGSSIHQFNTGTGFEYWYGAPKLIAIRMGYFYEDPRGGNRKFTTFGSGVRFDSYEFDFSYISASEKDHPLGGTLRFSLLASWGSFK